MRLDKFISQYTDHSRSQIQHAIKSGRVAVNDQTTTQVDAKLAGEEKITLGDHIITAFSTRYLMLYKPIGYICANNDSQHPVVLDLLPLARKQTLQIVGRLDIDTSGLVLLTDDGQWNHRITSPKHQCFKTYLVTTADVITPEIIAQFAQGVQLHGEKNLTRPARLDLIDDYNARLAIQEGKYHQVKRMFAAVGNRVISLHRETIGDITLDTELAPGQYRALTNEEVASVK